MSDLQIILDSKKEEAIKNGSCKGPLDLPLLISAVRANIVEVVGLNLSDNGYGFKHLVLYDRVGFVARSKTKVYF